ncbi:hypothetical protein FIBSPDRAFT_948421 [Athelia psychrophila]|uniref:Uncharacterized protein n=1 Tax=Athelia psychrophila TaxID=1759441 RepID=A0A166QSF6_9AGAM|nr:hypothetical protein FIBSPDRAFT_948403 [Fibularhizoctonia sp. CBS 109695]KZP27487.1 hypothetical protein FIBSPDRAFT_948421 [Fibularhizoctonia sp. CBS 109695]
MPAQMLCNELANITGCLTPIPNLTSFACLLVLNADVLGEANYYLTIMRGLYGITVFSAPVIDRAIIM